ncbi:MAG: hypothetical protein QOI24_1319 [Acidobacteriota bacterium]|jgi:hypothetical protein|nr:hypothetical protein [Acidobacteriota bacterium]
MSLTVNDRVRMIATFRYIEVRLMEISAAWTPTTPEMEVKVLFGRHIFDFAQHADWLGKRTFELRKPEHYTVKPIGSYGAVIEQMGSEEETANRLSALYDVFLPALENRYRAYVAATDRLLDEPSVVIIERILTDLARMQADARRLREHLSLQPIALGDLASSERAHSAIFAT